MSDRTLAHREEARAPEVATPAVAPAQDRGNAARQQDLRAGGALGGERAPVDELALDRVVSMVLAIVPREQAQYAATGVYAILRSAAYGGVRDANQVAYLLATAEHESRFGTPQFARSESLVEDHNPYTRRVRNIPARRGRPARTEESWHATPHAGNRRPITAGSEEELDTEYWDAAYGGRLGNRRGTDDAARFRGRGYAQVTGRVNYAGRTADLNREGAFYSIDGQMHGGQNGARPIDLTANPEHVNRSPELAADLLVNGARDGRYTRHRLSDHIRPGEPPDFVNARRVINGDVEENGPSIAAKARRYAAVLSGAWAGVFQARQTGPR